MQHSCMELFYRSHLYVLPICGFDPCDSIKHYIHCAVWYDSFKPDYEVARVGCKQMLGLYTSSALILSSQLPAWKYRKYFGKPIGLRELFGVSMMEMA